MAKTTARPHGHSCGDNHRLFILKDKEVEALYHLPQFSKREKAEYFTLQEEENALLVLFRTAVSKIFFILQLGYFKARKKIGKIIRKHSPLEARFGNIQDLIYDQVDRVFAFSSPNFAVQVVFDNFPLGIG